MVKIEDIIFWVLIALIVAISIWKLVGSPTDTSALISIALFVAGSEILLWKCLFNIEKKTFIGFEKVKSNLKNIEKEMKEINDNLKYRKR